MKASHKIIRIFSALKSVFIKQKKSVNLREKQSHNWLSHIRIYYVRSLALCSAVVNFSSNDKRRGIVRGGREKRNVTNVFYFENYRTVLEILIVILSMVAIFSVSTLLSLYLQRSR